MTNKTKLSATLKRHLKWIRDGYVYYHKMRADYSLEYVARRDSKERFKQSHIAHLIQLDLAEVDRTKTGPVHITSAGEEALKQVTT